TLSVVTQPTCSVASGSFTITNYNVANTYNVTPTTGVTIVGNTVTAPSGIYTVNASSGACTSPASAPAVINLFNNTSCASIALIKTAHHDDFNHDGFAQAGENIIYTFVITNTGLVPLTNITINDPLPGVIMSGGPISLGVGGVDSTSFTGVYTITTQDVINESVTNQATVYGTSPTGGIVNDLSDSTSITGDNGTVLPIKACKVDVFNAVTPNNDGNNDYLFIKGLDCYTDNSIEIYNRWGVKVYETQGYDNSIRVFRGYSEGRVTINKSEPLPNGTYYYVLKYKDFNGNGLTKTGFLYLTL
uniref:T9SS type B sorting domain-containing protein n=1 Tax=Flavobacterium sp. TaxID=239 RepID=UPI0037BF3D44